jgi:hypothetical protein
MNRLIMIGGRSDGDSAELGEGMSSITVEYAKDDPKALFVDDHSFIFTKETYHVMRIAGVFLLVSEDLSPNDVMHTLISSYIKQ